LFRSWETPHEARPHPGEPTPVTAEDRERLSWLEKRLAELGLKRGRW
jgi:hypothetical protein